MICPNKSHPDWKALVAKVGELNAMHYFLLNGENIPSLDFVDNYSLPEHLKPYDFSELLDGFSTYTTQNEAVKTVTSSVLYVMRVDDKGFNEAFDIIAGDVERAAGGEEVNKFTPLHKNIEAIKELSRDWLTGMGLLRGRTDEEIEAFDGIEAPDVDLNTWKDDWVLSFDSKMHAGEAVKGFLSFIPKTIYDTKKEDWFTVNGPLTGYIIDEEGKKVPDPYPALMPYDTVYDTLKGIIAESHVPPVWEEVEKILIKHQISKPWIHSLLESFKVYEGDRQKLIHQFVTTMASTYASSKTILWNKNKDNEYQLKIVETDQNTVKRKVIFDWTSSFKSSAFLQEDEEGNINVNKSLVTSIIDRIKNESKIHSPKKSIKILEDLGITLSEETKKALENRLDREYGKSGLFTILVSDLTRFIQEVENDEGDEDMHNEEDEENHISSFDPFIRNSGIARLAKDEARYGDYSFTNSYTNGEGKSVQSYIFNNALTLEFKRLFRDASYLKQVLGRSFNGIVKRADGGILYKNWLHNIQNNPIWKEVVSVIPIDTIKEQGQDKTGIKVTKMSPLDLEVSRVALFQNGGIARKGVGRIMNYLFTVPSKTLSWILTVPAFDVEVFFDNKKNTYSLAKTTNDAIYAMAVAEWNRILSSQQKSASKNEAYAKGSKQFLLFPSLNNLPIFHKDGKILLPTTKVDGVTAEKLVRDEMDKIIRKEVEETYERWKNLGLVQDKTNKKTKETSEVLAIVDTKYKKKLKGTEANKITQAVLDYVINTHLAKFNLHQTAIGDPALFWKDSIELTHENVAKRTAGLIAPRKELSLDHVNDKFIYLTMLDKKNGNSALNLAQLLKRLKDQGIPYENIEGTDAQEYTTLQEDLYMKYRAGMLSTDTYKSILDRYDKEGDALVLTPEELGFVFGATKPVFFDNRVDEEDDVIYRDYVKSSHIPLLPQFTNGLEINKLRVAMEKLQKEEDMFVRAAYKTAFKVGAKTFAKVFENDGTIKNDLTFTKDNYIKVRRAGIGIQQEVPYDTTEGEVTKSTQVTKLLFDAILHVEGFRHKGDKISGDSLYDIYKELNGDLFKSSLKKLTEAITNTDGSINEKKLHGILVKEALKRGYSRPDILWLGLDSSGNFANRLWTSPSSFKYESLLTSLFTNRVVKQDMYGRSFVLVSEEAIEGRSLGVTYIGKGKTITEDRTIEDLLGEALTDEQKNKTVSILSIDPTDSAESLEDQNAGEAISEIQKQYERLEMLRKCLTA